MVLSQSNALSNPKRQSIAQRERKGAVHLNRPIRLSSSQPLHLFLNTLSRSESIRSVFVKHYLRNALSRSTLPTVRSGLLTLRHEFGRRPFLLHQPTFHSFPHFLPEPSLLALYMSRTRAQTQMRREHLPLLFASLLPRPLQGAAVLSPFTTPIRNIWFPTSSSPMTSSSYLMLLSIPQLLRSVLELHQAPPLLLLSMPLIRNTTFLISNLTIIPSGCSTKPIRIV